MTSIETEKILISKTVGALVFLLLVSFHIYTVTKSQFNLNIMIAIVIFSFYLLNVLIRLINHLLMGWIFLIKSLKRTNLI